jgi:hypothetical protein
VLLGYEPAQPESSDSDRHSKVSAAVLDIYHEVLSRANSVLSGSVAGDNTVAASNRERSDDGRVSTA